MHEFSITQSMLSLALEKANEAKASKITKINLVIGDLSCIVDECVRFYFDFLSKDTAAAGASLSFERRATRLRCRNCETAFPPGKISKALPGISWQDRDLPGRFEKPLYPINHS